jgi:hypothetical protein
LRFRCTSLECAPPGGRKRPWKAKVQRAQPRLQLTKLAGSLQCRSLSRNGLTLRKGGIREENKHFELEHERFFLYPTFDHQRNNLVRESHHPELRRALEEGVWPDEEPPPKALLQDGGIPQPDRVRLRAWAEVVDHVTINDRRTLDSLSPYYIWTPDYAEKRLSWKRRHPLHVLLLRVHRIPRPVTVRVRDEYHGCRSWVEIDRELPFEGTPVMADEEFDRAREEITQRCGAGEPALV